jgi:hypothetical protein
MIGSIGYSVKTLTAYEASGKDEVLFIEKQKSLKTFTFDKASDKAAIEKIKQLADCEYAVKEEFDKNRYNPFDPGSISKPSVIKPTSECTSKTAAKP